jgi:hypothetical protein
LHNTDKEASDEGNEANDIEIFDEASFETPPDSPKESQEKINFEKSFFKQNYKKTVLLSKMVKQDSKQIIDKKLQMIMKDAMESPSN